MHAKSRYVMLCFGLVCLLALGLVTFLGDTDSIHAVAPGVDVRQESEEILVPGGEYRRGCAVDYNNGKCDGDAQPIHVVWVSDFYIDKTEVTNAQYAACVAAGACSPPLSNSSNTRQHYYDNPTYAEYPIINVDWPRAVAYCAWRGKRLPTEAEWEKAARGTDLRWYPWGNEDPTCELANYSPPWGTCLNDTASVHSYPQGASPYGVLNMAGNVSEWVQDLYYNRYYHTTPYFDPQGPESTAKMEHPLRGGSWAEHQHNGTNTWVRLDESEIYKHLRIGFRCARPAGSRATPIPTPTPSPAPSQGQLDQGGGLVWQSYRNHLTVVHLRPGAASQPVDFTLSYELLPRNQGLLGGLNHYFRLESSLPLENLNPPPRLLLGFDESGGVKVESLNLYRLEAGEWVTRGVTVTERSAGHLIVEVTETGLYGLLGRTQRVHMPVILQGGSH